MNGADARLLIVNADDYGLTEGMARAILDAHRDGVVTSVSVLAVGPAFDRTAPWLLDRPGLGVGCHLAAVGEDPPLLSRREIPTLVDRRGRFPLSWRTFLARAAAGRVDPADLGREFTAQLDRCVGAGLRPTHLDTHQHLHLWPQVGRVVTRLARRRGVPAVRLPSSHARGLRGGGIRLLSRRLAGELRASGLAAPDLHTGLDEAGALTLPRFVTAVELLAGLPGRTAEINCHPGPYADAARGRYAWRYRWGEELAALVSPDLRDTIVRHGFRLGTYAGLPAPGRPVPGRQPRRQKEESL